MSITKVAQGSTVTNGSPAFGATTTAGNLLALICCSNSATLSVITGSGWLEAVHVASTGASHIHIFYKPNCGAGETAPTVTNAGVASVLLEFNTSAAGTILNFDQSGTAVDQPNSGSVTCSGSNVASGELVIGGQHYRLTATSALTVTNSYNNGVGTPNSIDNNNGTNTTGHYNFQWGATTTNSAAEKNTTTKDQAVNASSYVLATFKVNTVNTSSLSGTLTSTGTRVANTFRALSASVSLSGIRNIIANRAFTATVTSAGANVKSIVHKLTATISPSALLNRFMSHSLSAILISQGGQTKQTSRSLSATITSQGDQTKLNIRTLAATLLSSALLNRFVARALNATSILQGDQIKQTDRTMSSDLTLVSILTTRIQIFFSAILSTSSELSKTVYRLLPDSIINLIGVISNQTNKSIDVVLEFSSILVKGVSIVRSSTLEATGDFTKTSMKRLEALVNSTGSFISEFFPSVPAIILHLTANLAMRASLGRKRFRLLDRLFISIRGKAPGQDIESRQSSKNIRRRN